MRLTAIMAALLAASCGGKGQSDAPDGDASDPVETQDPSEIPDQVDTPDPVETMDMVDSADPVEDDACDPLVISDLATEDNPFSTISFWVTWRTNRPATSLVEHGEDTSYGSSRGSTDLVTDHRTLVVGCPPLTTIHFQAVSDDAGGEEARSPDSTYLTGDLPAQIPPVTLEAAATAAAQPGVTLMNISHPSTGAPDVVVYLDMQGRVIWYWVGGGSDTAGGVNTQQLGGGIVLVSGAIDRPWTHVDLSGEVVLEGVQPPEGEGNVHHDTIQLSDGSTAVVRAWTIPHPLDASYELTYDSMEILDTPTGASIWSWSTIDHLPLPPVETRAWTHGNAILVDPVAGFAWFNLKKIDRFLKIDIATGEIVWQMGDPAKCAECDFSMSGPGTWWSKAHAPELLPDGHILWYDNGLDGVPPQYSRAVEYEIDETAMTVTQVWEYSGPPTWFTSAWGDADRLPNGNTLVTAGASMGGESSRVFEVTTVGEIAWAITLPATYGVYRADRLDSIER